jgi:hypothetical protein
VTGEEAAAITGRLIGEAVFSATKDRRRLMAAAMAGAFSPDFEIEQKSRITRAVAQLEPSDIVALRDIDKGTPVGHGLLISMEAMQEVRRKRAMSLDALAGAGCLVEVVVQKERTEVSGIPRPERREHRLTDLGELTLKFIADWEPSAQGADESPGP